MRASLLWLAAAAAVGPVVNGFRPAPTVQPLRLGVVSSLSSRGRVAALPTTTTTMALRPFSLFPKNRQPQLAPTTTATATAAVRGGPSAVGGGGQGCDFKAIATYVGATALQISAIGGFLYGMEWAFATLKLAPIVKLWIVRVFFALTALKSRVFSPLDNSRPSVAREEQRKRERKRPGWM